jgi:hypothetical protein
MEISVSGPVDSLEFPNDDLLDHMELFDTDNRNRVTKELKHFATDIMSVLEEYRLFGPILRTFLNSVRIKGDSLILSNIVS